MPLKAVERERSYRVDWIFPVDSVTNFAKETYQTNRFDYLSTYTLSCFACLPCSEAILTRGRQYEVRLRLQRLDETMDSSSEDDQTEDENVNQSDSYEERPSAVWYSINRADFTEFKCASTDLWDSGVFFVREEQTSDEDRWEIDITVWLQYDQAEEKPEGVKTAGERNALKQFSYLITKQTLCDVQFQFENGESIGGHRAILIGRSPIFGSVLKQDDNENQKHQINIEDVQPGIFRKLLHYIYCGKIPVQLSEDLAKQLYVAADKYGVDDLKEECISYLLSHIRADNALRLMDWSNQHSVTLLQEATVSFAVENFKEICVSNEWKRCMKTCNELCLRITRGVAVTILSSVKGEEDT